MLSSPCSPAPSSTCLAHAAGGIGYSLFCGSYGSYNHTTNKGFVYFGGAACGISTTLLWSAEGAIVTSLPWDKGRYISIFYGLFIFITVVEAIIPTVENWSVTTAGSANDEMYIALSVLILIGSALLSRKPCSLVVSSRCASHIGELRRRRCFLWGRMGGTRGVLLVWFLWVCGWCLAGF